LAASPPANGSERTHRPRDELFEELIAACGLSLEELTRSARGATNAALKQLREVNATPGEIGTRAGRFRSMYPGLTLTPNALAKHWPALAGTGANPSANGQRRSNTDAIREGFRRMGVTLE
jgi:hypothetical protein